MKTFIDESGNTGSDLNEERQPFFVLSAVTLMENKLKTLLDKLESQFIENKEKEETEIKAAKWSKSSKKSKALQNIIETVLNLEGHISIVIIEKRFMISAMIIDDFFDPEYNDVKNYDWINHTTKKIKAVNYFYLNLTDDIIHSLWSSIQKRNENELQIILEKIISLIDNTEYINLLQGAIKHIPELIKDDSTLDSSEKASNSNKRFIRSPNYTAYPAVMNPVIRYCNFLGRKTSIIFDSADGLNDVYKYIYDIFSQIKKDIPTPNGYLYSWKNSVKDFSALNSKNEKGIQIADIVSSSINQLMMKILKDKKMSEYDLFNLNLLTLLDNYNSVWYVNSMEFNKKYFNLKNDII